MKYRNSGLTVMMLFFIGACKLKQDIGSEVNVVGKEQKRSYSENLRCIKTGLDTGVVNIVSNDSPIFSSAYTAIGRGNFRFANCRTKVGLANYFSKKIVVPLSGTVTFDEIHLEGLPDRLELSGPFGCKLTGSNAYGHIELLADGKVVFVTSYSRPGRAQVYLARCETVVGRANFLKGKIKIDAENLYSMTDLVAVNSPQKILLKPKFSCLIKNHETLTDFGRIQLMYDKAVLYSSQYIRFSSKEKYLASCVKRAAVLNGKTEVAKVQEIEF